MYFKSESAAWGFDLNAAKNQKKTEKGASVRENGIDGFGDAKKFSESAPVREYGIGKSGNGFGKSASVRESGIGGFGDAKKFSESAPVRESGIGGFGSEKGVSEAFIPGLSPDAVKKSRRDFGENIVTQKKRKGFFSKLLENFGDPLIKILLVALGINVIFLFGHSEWYETAIIAAAILLATFVSTVSEAGSEAAFKKLQADAARANCKVIRGGIISEIPVCEVVVGDFVKLQAGDKIPADGYLVEGALDADQSALNGETKECAKSAAGSGFEYGKYRRREGENGGAGFENYEGNGLENGGIERRNYAQKRGGNTVESVTEKYGKYRRRESENGGAEFGDYEGNGLKNGGIERGNYAQKREENTVKSFAEKNGKYRYIESENGGAKFENYEGNGLENESAECENYVENGLKNGGAGYKNRKKKRFKRGGAEIRNGKKNGSAEYENCKKNGGVKHTDCAAKGSGENLETVDFTDKNLLFSGTVVCGGEGVMRVFSVGDRTFYGRLAGELQEDTASSPMKERLNELAKSISRFGYVGAVLVALAYLFNCVVVENGFEPILIKAFLANPENLIAKILYAVTLAVTVIVMAVPEGLPMMITVVLTSNMKKMMKDNVVVRKLVGIETAGSMNIIFCDKTGTLTEGKLKTAGLIDGEGNEFFSVNACPDGLREYVFHSLYFNNASSVSGGKIVGGNSTDRALLEFAARRDSKKLNNISYKNILPFSSDTKYMATEINGFKPHGKLVLIKGAPEILLPHCTEYVDADGRFKTLVKRRALEQKIAELQKRAYRIIVAAAAPELSPGCFKDLKLVGIAFLRDDVREEAKEGVRQIRGAGIKIVMITGDAKKTAEAIAREVGILDGKNSLVLTSGELNAMTDEEIQKILPSLCVVARALPNDKSRLVKIAQSMGLVAGMTGDGVNDAPALKKADVSFAMGSGTDVAKEAGDIVILDDNLLSIAKAVKYGRTIFKSIRKFIIFQLTLNFCAMGVSMLAPLFGISSPITVIQILWINIVMDTLAGLAFGGEAALQKYMDEPPKKRGEKIINGYMWLEIILGGAFSVLVCMWFLKSEFVAEMFFYAKNTRFYTAFFGLFMFMGIFNGFCARTQSINLADHIAGNKPFIIIMGAVSVVQVLILYFGGQIFRTNGLTANELIFIVLLAFTAVIANAVRKIFYRVFKLRGGY
ncbi:MAG: cation-transporting P-type ATPase [Clostridiales bacterium]|jgi:calcium-translocating P-type ATPase|nr:cation-transporting P-type ATPase [Clostridiales bacterium]